MRLHIGPSYWTEGHVGRAQYGGLIRHTVVGFIPEQTRIGRQDEREFVHGCQIVKGGRE